MTYFSAILIQHMVMNNGAHVPLLFCRIVVVLQNNSANDKLNTVMVAPLTSNLRARGYLLTVFVEAEKNGLRKDSVILLFQIRTLDKRRLEQKLTHLDDTAIEQIDQAIHHAFDL